MLNCPNCHTLLERVKGKGCVYLSCLQCGGRSATVALLRGKLERQTVNSLWIQAVQEVFPKKKLCPECSQSMSEVPVDCDAGVQLIDVCTRCQTVWFDNGEYDKFPKLPEKKSEYSDLPEKARIALATYKVEQISRRAEQAETWDSSPDEWWHWILGILGVAVEQGRGLSKIPYMIWSLAGIITAVSFIAFSDLSTAVMNLGLIPAQCGRYFGGTFISSVFLHGDIFHLISNMYFFLIFGDDVEEFMGKVKFLVLMFCAAIVGGFTHCLLDLDSQTPCIGASGAISGIIAYYALAFPKAKISLLFWIFLYPRWIKLSAFWLFIIWVGLQLMGVVEQASGLSNVSALAHIGGALTGVVFWLLTEDGESHDKPKKPKTPKNTKMKKVKKDTGGYRKSAW